MLTIDHSKRLEYVNVFRNEMIKNELNTTLDDIIPLTYNFSTSYKAHDLLGEIIKIQCEVNKARPYYGLELTDELKPLIRIAN